MNTTKTFPPLTLLEMKVLVALVENNFVGFNASLDLNKDAKEISTIVTRLINRLPANAIIPSKDKRKRIGSFTAKGCRIYALCKTILEYMNELKKELNSNDI